MGSMLSFGGLLPFDKAPMTGSAPGEAAILLRSDLRHRYQDLLDKLLNGSSLYPPGDDDKVVVTMLKK